MNVLWDTKLTEKITKDYLFQLGFMKKQIETSGLPKLGLAKFISVNMAQLLLCHYLSFSFPQAVSTQIFVHFLLISVSTIKGLAVLQPISIINKGVFFHLVSNGCFLHRFQSRLPIITLSYPKHQEDKEKFQQGKCISRKIPLNHGFVFM